MHRAEFGSVVSSIMTMPHFALILEITPLKLGDKHEVGAMLYIATWMTHLETKHLIT